MKRTEIIVVGIEKDSVLARIRVLFCSDGTRPCLQQQLWHSCNFSRNLVQF
ncbi:MAG: hypothetical protein LBC74_12185 [Planctomycetaceae bacterium]|nr:hypothetical protein [Planctomycetaceae bacterium]